MKEASQLNFSDDYAVACKKAEEIEQKARAVKEMLAQHQNRYGHGPSVVYSLPQQVSHVLDAVLVHFKLVDSCNSASSSVGQYLTRKNEELKRLNDTLSTAALEVKIDQPAKPTRMPKLLRPKPEIGHGYLPPLKECQRSNKPSGIAQRLATIKAIIVVQDTGKVSHVTLSGSKRPTKWPDNIKGIHIPTEHTKNESDILCFLIKNYKNALAYYLTGEELEKAKVSQ